jgi:hypothetical protein
MLLGGPTGFVSIQRMSTNSSIAPAKSLRGGFRHELPKFFCVWLLTRLD